MHRRQDTSITRTDRGDHTASDEQLLHCYRERGNRQAFEALVHRYEKPILHYLLRYLRNAPLAEEVFQATFLRLHEKCEDYDSGRRVRPWLYSIATHLAVDALRSEGRHQAVRLDDEHAKYDTEMVNLAQLLSSDTPSPGEEAEEHERAEWARRAVHALPDHERIAVLLVFFQGLKYREAAKSLGVPEGTLKSRIHRALVTLHRTWRRNHTLRSP